MLGVGHLVSDIDIVPAVDAHVPAAAPVKKFTAADPSEFRNATGRKEASFHEARQGPKAKVILKFFRGASERVGQFVGDVDCDLHVISVSGYIQHADDAERAY